jgi:hypothetical protein
MGKLAVVEPVRAGVVVAGKGAKRQAGRDRAAQRRHSHRLTRRLVHKARQPAATRDLVDSTLELRLGERNRRVAEISGSAGRVHGTDARRALGC